MSFYREPMKITSPTLHATIWFTLAVFIAVLVMSFVFKVEVVAQGEGRVVPVSRVQVVQSEFSGQIVDIKVRNGMEVIEGDILVELDPTNARADLGTIQAESDRLKIEAIRISAMIQGLDYDPTDEAYEIQVLARFIVPDDLEQHPFVNEQRMLLTAEITDFLSSWEQIQAREISNRRSEDVTNANIDRVTAALEIQTERFSITETLVQQGTTSRAAFLDAQQTLAGLERERDVYLRELDQKVAERSALNAERNRLISSLRSSLLDRRSQIDARLATLTQEQRAAERRLDGTMLRAPTSGIIDQLSVFTIGGVIDAGTELMRVVPTNAEMEFESVFSNQDIGFLEIDQIANIGLHAYPSARFGFVKGRVTDIAADSTEVAEGQWGFTVRVQPEQMRLEAGEERFAMRPGMTATINVTTDERRIISYFFAPIVETIQNSLGER